MRGIGVAWHRLRDLLLSLRHGAAAAGRLGARLPRGLAACIDVIQRYTRPWHVAAALVAACALAWAVLGGQVWDPRNA